MSKNNITILVWVYKNKLNKKGLAPLYIRVSYSQQRKNIATGYSIDPERWCKERHTAFTCGFDYSLDKYFRTEVSPAAGIKKPLTMHIARHTFGNISGDRIPIQMLQKLYRHSSVTTTIGYQANFIHKDTDAALDAVVGF